MSESHYDRCRAYFNQAAEQNEDVPAQTDLDILKIVLVAEIMEHHCSAPIVDIDLSKILNLLLVTHR